MGVFDDDDDEDIVADWVAFDAIVEQHQQKKQVRGALPREMSSPATASCMHLCMLQYDGCFGDVHCCNAHCRLPLSFSNAAAGAGDAASAAAT